MVRYTIKSANFLQTYGVDFSLETQITRDEINSYKREVYKEKQVYTY